MNEQELAALRAELATLRARVQTLEEGWAALQPKDRLRLGFLQYRENARRSEREVTS